MSSSPEETEAQQQVLKPKSRKKWYLLTGSIVLIVAAFSSWSMLSSEAEAVALGINYSQGERMTYEIDMAMEMMDQEYSYTMTYREDKDSTNPIT